MVLEMLMANQPLDLISKFSKFSKEKIAEIGKTKRHFRDSIK